MTPNPAVMMNIPRKSIRDSLWTLPGLANAIRTAMRKIAASTGATPRTSAMMMISKSGSRFENEAHEVYSFPEVRLFPKPCRLSVALDDLLIDADSNLDRPQPFRQGGL